jgi:uncharacterized protein YfkK (UPF0435 family)
MQKLMQQPEISTKLKSLNAHITNAKKSQEQEKIDNLQFVYHS